MSVKKRIPKNYRRSRRERRQWFADLLLGVELVADGHDHGEDDQVPEVAHLVAQQAGDDHEDGTDDGQHGQHIAAQGGLGGLVLDPAPENGQVHGVDGDDGQLGGIKDESGALESGALEHHQTVHGAGQVGHVEVQHPGGAQP